MAKNNYPQAGLDELGPEFVSEVVQSLKELNDLGKPETDQEVADRIEKYFEFCQKNSSRPGIEGLCLALHISRTTLYNWNLGVNCSAYRQEVIANAKRFIGAFIEQAMLRGRISPPSGIFLMKNWLDYKDTVSFENTAESKPVEQHRTAEQIAADYGPQTALPGDIVPDF